MRAGEDDPFSVHNYTSFIQIQSLSDAAGLYLHRDTESLVSTVSPSLTMMQIFSHFPLTTFVYLQDSHFSMRTKRGLKSH